MPLRGGQCPLRGRPAARPGAAEDVREVWLQGFLAAGSEPRRHRHLPLRPPAVHCAGAVTGLPAAGRLHQGTVTAQEVFGVWVKAVSANCLAHPLWETRRYWDVGGFCNYQRQQNKLVTV